MIRTALFPFACILVITPVYSGGHPVPAACSSLKTHRLNGELPDQLGSQSELELALPGGRVMKGRIDRRDRRLGGWTLSGRTGLEFEGTFVLLEEDGELLGWIQDPRDGETFLRLIGDRLVAETGPPLPLGCGTDSVRVVRAGAPNLGAITSAPETATSVLGPSGAGGSLPASAGACPCDDGRTIDLLVVHTPAARTNPNSAGSGLDTFIQLTVDVANQAFVASEIRTSLNVVHVAELAYTDDEDPTLFIGVHLDRLANPNDGFLDHAHVLRDQYAADLVTLFVHTPQWGGIAYGLGGPASGFSANSITSVVPTLTHEIGHNLGASHDPATIRETTGLDPLSFPVSYGFGHKFEVASTVVGTVMSYTGPGEVGIVQFSNPDVTFSGVPTGVYPGAKQPVANAWLLDVSRTWVSSYRDDGFRDCNANGIDDVLELGAGPSVDSDGDGVLDECQRRMYADAGGPGGDGRSWDEAWPDLKDQVFISSLPCSEIRELWVAGGTYKPDRERRRRDMSFEFSSGSVTIYGGFLGTETDLTQRNWLATPTILSGDIGGDDSPELESRLDNSYHVLHMPVGGTRRRGSTGSSSELGTRTAPSSRTMPAAACELRVPRRGCTTASSRKIAHALGARSISTCARGPSSSPDASSPAIGAPSPVAPSPPARSGC